MDRVSSDQSVYPHSVSHRFLHAHVSFKIHSSSNPHGLCSAVELVPAQASLTTWLVAQRGQWP